MIRDSEGPIWFTPGDVEWQAAQFEAKNRRPSAVPADSCCAGMIARARIHADRSFLNGIRLIFTSLGFQGTLWLHSAIKSFTRGKLNDQSDLLLPCGIAAKLAVPERADRGAGLLPSFLTKMLR